MTSGTTRFPPRLSRSRTDRVLGGVCAGVARQIGLDPWLLRLAVLALALAGGTGVLLYVVAWLLLPEEGSDRSLAQAAAGGRRPDLGEVLAVGSIVLGLILLVRATGLWFDDAVVWPLLLAGGGLVVIWRQAGADDRSSLLRVVDRLPRSGGGQPSLDLRSRRASWPVWPWVSSWWSAASVRSWPPAMPSPPSARVSWPRRRPWAGRR